MSNQFALYELYRLVCHRIDQTGYSTVPSEADVIRLGRHIGIPRAMVCVIAYGIRDLWGNDVSGLFGLLGYLEGIPDLRLLAQVLVGMEATVDMFPSSPRETVERDNWVRLAMCVLDPDAPIRCKVEAIRLLYETDEEIWSTNGVPETRRMKSLLNATTDDEFVDELLQTFQLDI